MPHDLAVEKLGKRKRDSAVEAVIWVSWAASVDGVGPQDAPSATSWGLLRWVRADEKNLATFWSSIWPKTFPSRGSGKGGEELGPFGDDLSPQDETVKKGLNAYLAELQQRARSEKATEALKERSVEKETESGPETDSTATNRPPTDPSDAPSGPETA